MIKDVTSAQNSAFGLVFQGPNITVKDSTFSYNYNGGIRIIGGYDFNQIYTSKIQFEGKVSSHHHFGYLGIGVINNVPLKDIEVNVKGDVVTYLNSGGVYTYTALSNRVDFTVESEGSFIACQNSASDISSAGWGGVVTFIDEGVDGYACDTQILGDHVQSLMPACLACPACT